MLCKVLCFVHPPPRGNNEKLLIKNNTVQHTLDDIYLGYIIDEEDDDRDSFEKKIAVVIAE